MTNEELLNAALANPPSYLPQSANPMQVPTATQPARLPTIREAMDFARDGTRIQLTKPTREDVRQSDGLPPGYKPRAVGEMSFDPRLAYEVALDLDDPVVTFSRYGYDERAAVALLNDAVFSKQVKTYKDEINTSGIGFKLKAKIQAEDLLTHSYQIATDPEVPASVRKDLIIWTAKMAGYEPKESEGGKGGGGTFALNITIAGQPVTVSARIPREVTTIEQEGS